MSQHRIAGGRRINKENKDNTIDENTPDNSWAIGSFQI
jgi:hypothetical protein